ncbi:unnamed protein product [Durusdinium trenchii]|uniref:FYVE-type domain-containing protein n=1 Tax=Durusdinium trenchii TaxID=1381693 RepID=A0ABP0MVK3_9DINO
MSVNGPTPTSSLIGSDDGQADGKETHCPRCRSQFTTYFRRHHCRNCGGLVCDDCSRNRTRIPRDLSLGIVRVCDDCFKTIGDHNAAGAEEDLVFSQQLIERLRAELAQKHTQIEAFKKVLLELEAEASKDSSQLDEYAQDPHNDDFSFGVLQDKVQKSWSSMTKSLEAQGSRKLQLEEQQRAAMEQQKDLAKKEEELMAKRQELDAQLAEVSRLEARRDELSRKEAELQRAVANERQTVRELEMSRKAQQEMEAERMSLQQWRARPRGSSEPVAFTISTGREELRRNRLEGCKRACIIS